MPRKKILIVATDLKRPSAEYKLLFEVLKSQGAWSHYLRSIWLVATDKTANDVYREVKPHIMAGDRIFVAEMGDSRQGWLPKKAWNWIKRHEESNHNSFNNS